MLCDPIEIIVISYHRPDDFTICIDSILQNTTVPFNLTIIDNSCGAIDEQLQKYESIANIIRNDRNIGKGASFKLWYNDIIKESNANYIISMDADIKVPPSWLIKLISTSTHLHMPLGALAPVLQNDESDDFEAQSKRKSITMHGGVNGYLEMVEISNGVFYNVKTAGSLFLISREFYERIGGYPGDILFGHDDGYICNQAKMNKRFIGFTSKVECIHLNNNNTDMYKSWKMKNLNMARVHKGYWD